MTQPNYRLKDDHVATAGHLRSVYTQLDTAKLNKSGGVITGDIFATSDVNPLNALATKQYVLDNAGSGGGSGGGSHPDKIESQDAQKSTSVLCTTDGVTISDDSTAIAIISKNIDRTQIKSELSGMALNTNDLIIRSQNGATDLLNINSTAIQTTIPITYSSAFTPTQDYQLGTKKYTDDKVAQEVVDRNSAIATAKTQITQLVDSDQTDGAKYKLQIANNQLEYFRGAESDDLYLKQFGSASSDGVVFQTNKSRYFLESDNAIDAENYIMLRNQVSADPANMYNKAGIMSLRYGYVGETTPNAYCAVTAQASEAGSGSTRMLLYPKTVNNNAELVNQAMFNARLGYESGTVLANQDADSILKRSENDSRYYLSTTTLDGILQPQNPLAMNSKRITGVADATGAQDAATLQQVTQARQGFSIVRKTTNTQTVNAKVTGFTLQQESNATKAYWDNANQVFLISIPVGDASVDVEFNVRITYNITATGNNATFVLRDFTNNSNYADTFLYASKQNQNGFFTENLNIFKNFTTNRFVGLYVTAQNGSPPFANLDIVMSAKTITTSTQVNQAGISNPGNTVSVSIVGPGLKANQTGQIWDLNTGVIKGLPNDLYTEPYSGDHVASLDYVNTAIAAQGQTQAAQFLTNSDNQRFQPAGTTKSFTIRDLNTLSDKFVVQADVPTGSTTFTTGNSLRLAYQGTKALTDDSLVTRGDVNALIAAGGAYPNYYTFRINIGDVPSGVESFQSTDNIISNVAFTLYADNNIGSYLVALSGYPYGNISGDSYEVIISMRSLRTGTPSALDNDYHYPVVANRANLSFEILLEQSFNVVQNVAIVGTIMKF